MFSSICIDMRRAVRTDRRAVTVKMGQLWRLVRESHERPMAGEPRPAERVSEGELGVTFIGHSSFFLQVGGRTLLVDPVFSKRLILLRRQRQPGLDWREMPAVDVVLLTHAHMDHLNVVSLRRAIRRTVRLRGRAPEVVVPKGVEDLVDRLGFAAVHGMEWWEEREVAGLRVTMTPAKHWGARMFSDTHRGYGGYVIEGGGASVYHSGDTAYFGGFREVGQRLAPQVALLPIGAYFPDNYRAVHTSPEEALRGFVETGAEVMVPMHFGTFRLGREPMEEPPVRLMEEARRLGLEDRVAVLEEGQTLRMRAARAVESQAARMV
jgi:L-ascorbate metabolism protein UlaG (beta-lactamase superfamily)